jgi:hypothetical protein
LFAEKVITAKNDLPDSYFGLKVGAVVSPAFGFKIRDKASGQSNVRKDDRTGFSMPWTLLMISKEWEEKKISVEFWGEILRSSSITSDTIVDNPNSPKTNPYILGIRRANVKKQFDLRQTTLSFIFGIQELPHTYTQWKGYWNWRYIDRAPLESLGFSPAPADIGASFLLKYKNINYHIGLVNGEGFREIQNSNSSGLDAVGRFSFEPEFQSGKIKLALSAFGRAGNIIGVSGNECKEGVTNCLPNDNNPRTRLERDIRFQKSESLGSEINFLFNNFLNLGGGIMDKKFYTGFTYDKLNPGNFNHQTDTNKRAAYFWFGINYKDFSFVMRTERGKGFNGVVTRTNDTFIKNTVFFEYNFSDFARFAFGGSILTNYGSLGQEKVYIDNFGDTRTFNQYFTQYTSQVNQGIVQYSVQDKQIFIRSTFDF